MGVFTYDYETTSPVAPIRLFKAFTVESPKIWPTAAPNVVKSVEVEANPSSGSIIKINFVEGFQFQYMKHKIGAHDESTLSYSYDLIEGGYLGDKLEKVTYENKFEAAPGGGSICKSSIKYYTIGDNITTEDEIKACIKGSEELYKPVEAYLLANPEVCN